MMTKKLRNEEECDRQQPALRWLSYLRDGREISGSADFRSEIYWVLIYLSPSADVVLGIGTSGLGWGFFVGVDHVWSAVLD